ncbi:MAG TPA: M67 family metallopeptidase [Candidatus Nitrosotalea sp.]|nr:M67 family metallopeptidase [Candidatus Nitrosotalea sp.]HEU5489060.1 M67 family metallopeptidase [Candidatus Nitrosotalea sp.]
MTGPKSVILSKPQVQILVNHARDIAPNESCAVLFGNTVDGNVLVEDIFITKNIENSPVNFTIAPEELISAYNAAEKKKLEVIGIFHSHPDSVAYPSSTDKKYMEINPVPWIIFSNQNNEFKAYIYDSGLVPVPVKIS